MVARGPPARKPWHGRGAWEYAATVRRRTVAIVTWAVATVGVGVGTAAADPAADAKALAQAGEAKVKAGDFVGGAAAYRQAFKLDPKPEYVCNVGVSYYKGSDWPRAQLFLTECLLQGSALPSSFLDSLRKVQAAIEGKLRGGSFAPVTLVIEPASATVAVRGWAPDETFVGGRTIWLPAGAQALDVIADGYVADTLAPTLEAGKLQTLRVTLRPTPTPPIDGPAEPTGPALEPPAPVEPVDAPPGKAIPPAPIGAAATKPPSRTPFVIAAVGTGVVGLASLGLYGLALAKASDARQEIDGSDPHQALVEAAELRRNLAVGGAVLTAVGAGASVYLWWRARPRATERAVAVGVVPTVGGASAAVVGRF